LNHVKEEMML